MKNTPLVSVIVATYNQEKFIGRCLRWLLLQSMALEKYEIIVINDSSNDRTPFASELFHGGCEKGFRSIRIIHNNKNIGLAASLNKAIRVAHSPYIVRVDSDDYVNKYFLKFLTEYLLQNPEIDAVASDYIEVDDQEEVLGRYNCTEDPIACGILFNKERLIDIGLYDEAFRCQEERDLRIRFEKKYNIDRLKIPLYRYRKHKNNMTSNRSIMNKYEMKLLYKHGMEYA